MSPFCPPPKLQLALALAVVKSKPSNTTIRDHVAGMRSHLVVGKRKQTDLTGEKHLDGTAFWRKAYEKSEAAQSALQDRIYELEQKNEALLLKAKPTDAPEIPPSTAKRKAKTDDAQPQPARSQKRSKTMGGGNRSGSLMPGYSPNYDLNDLRLPEDGAIAPLMRRFHMLQSLLRKKIGSESPAIRVVGLCKAFENAILLAMETVSKPRGTIKSKGARPPQPTICEVLLTLERCYPAILQSLSRESKAELGSDNTGLMVYHIVQLFVVVVQQMHQFTLCKAEKSPNSRKPTGKSKSKATSSVGNLSGRLTKEDQKTLDCFSHCITVMLVSLHPGLPGQSKLIEGLLFIFLEQVGKTLGLLVFKQLLSDPETDAESMPGCLTHLQTHRCDAGVADQAAAWSGKYLIWVLERAMVFVNRNLPTLSTSERPEASATEPQTLDLLERAKTRLQNTLLKGVFGTTDPAFHDSLKLPDETTCPQIGDTTSYANADEDPKEWFSQEVWRILGWDSLVRTF